VRTTSARLCAGVAAVALLGLAGCGGTDPQQAKAAHGLSRELQGQHLTAKDANCISKEWVDKTGTDRLVQSGVLTKQLQANPHNKTRPSKDVVVGFVDAYFDCVDYGRLEAQKFDAARPNLINKDRFAACANEINRSDAKQAMVDDLLGKQTGVATSVNHQLISCAVGK
jgi:hypothetical protein